MFTSNEVIDRLSKRFPDIYVHGSSRLMRAKSKFMTTNGKLTEVRVGTRFSFDDRNYDELTTEMVSRIEQYNACRRGDCDCPEDLACLCGNRKQRINGEAVEERQRKTEEYRGVPIYPEKFFKEGNE